MLRVDALGYYPTWFGGHLRVVRAGIAEIARWSGSDPEVIERTRGAEPRHRSRPERASLRSWSAQAARRVPLRWRP